MLSEYKQTFDILKKQKNNIMNILKENNLDFENNQQLIEKLCYMDNKIKEYTNKIENEKYNNKNKNIVKDKKENINIINSKNNNINEIDDNDDIKDESDNKNNKNKYIQFKLENYVIQKILKNNGKTEINRF